MFTIKGIIDNKELFVKWDDKKLTGDTEVINKALDENKKEHGWLGLGAEQVDKYYLKYEYPAHHLLVKFVFDKIIEETNDHKPLPSTAIP